MYKILCEIDPNDTVSSLTKSYVYTPDGQILYQCFIDQSDPNEYFYIHDRLGSVRLVVDEEGDVVNSYTYDPFGKMFAAECSETVANPFKFTGQWFDEEISQYYLRARQYDPQIMRFTARDPIKGDFRKPLTLHPYLYCLNDSLNRIDPSGEYSSVEQVVTTSLVTATLKRPNLAYNGRIYEMMNSTGGITALKAMAQLTDLAAYWNKNNRGVFVEDLLWMFTERDQNMRHVETNLDLEFNDTGFRGSGWFPYRDGSNQVRHFVGCLGAGYFWGRSVGRAAVWENERRGTFTWPDVWLGYAGVDLGTLISGDVGDIINISDVGNWMRNHLGD